MIINVCIICLLCSFGIRSHGPFSHLFLWGFLLYSGEEHFTFTSVQSPTGRLVFKALKLFHCLLFNQVFTVHFRKPQQSLVSWTRTVSCLISMTTMTSGTSCLLLPCFAHLWWDTNQHAWSLLPPYCFCCNRIFQLHSAFSIRWPMYTTDLYLTSTVRLSWLAALQHTLCVKFVSTHLPFTVTCCHKRPNKQFSTCCMWGACGWVRDSGYHVT